ncbi:unnamed protein product [Prorocentrum cordatum]|uniref:Uncharacterized protein n=1 Tax=Prorocentrum cordatum TaxID=2364126 RepID=A0ABN9XLC4_9DINO|nr:unnamed protein product [Polarella glacialis]
MFQSSIKEDWHRTGDPAPAGRNRREQGQEAREETSAVGCRGGTATPFSGALALELASSSRTAEQIGRPRLETKVFLSIFLGLLRLTILPWVQLLQPRLRGTTSAHG